MSFNLFGQPTKDDIKVGYIDPTLGYVDDVSVCEANEYAKNNPGTVFIFRDGDNNILYLNINEVNKLTPSDLVAKNDECKGIQYYKECGPPRIQFFGGNGIGAVGNPVVGLDGSILAVDVVSGGHGYQYPPLVSAKDDCQIGNGAVLTSVLGEIADRTEVYEGEEDFEDYEICESNEVGYGLKYGPNGEILGPWEPGIYTKIGTDPIRREIEAFQSALKNPFWTTRESQPDRIIVQGKQYATQEATNVTDIRWGEFMNAYAISPVKPSDTLGTDEAGKVFSIEWELNFPISGEYIFRGVCDNVGKLFIDDSLVGDLKNFDQNPSPLQKTIQEGNHIVRVELVNVPEVEKTITQTENAVDVTFKITGNGRNTNKMKFSFVSDEQTFTLKGNDKSGESSKVTVKINPKSKFKVYASSTKEGGVEQGIIKNGTKNKEGGKGDSQRIFADHIQSDNDNDDLQITTDIGSFRAFNKRKADEGRSTFDLEFSVDDGNQNPQTVIDEIISSKSWAENPIGVSMIIEAPVPPVPQEQLPLPVGECPPNPIWTTRFTGSDQQWYPVKNERWSNFFNRYAISPVLPLDTDGSDGSGIVHRNTWNIDIPYKGFYKFQVQRDNTARIYVDGNLAFDVTTSGDDKWIKSGLVNKVKAQKVFLEKGAHTISIELENTPQDVNSFIEEKIFSTQDWRVPNTSNSSQVDVIFRINEAGSDGSSIEISDILTANEDKDGREISKKVEVGKVYTVKASPSNRRLKSDGSIIRLEDSNDDDFNDLVIRANQGKFYDVNGNTAKFVVENTKSLSPTSISKNGVTYDGPELFGHLDRAWGNYMNKYSVSPKVFNSINQPDERVIGSYTLTWKNVTFPEDGSYNINFQADNTGTVFVGGKKIIESSQFTGEKSQYTFNATAGTYDISIVLDNLKSSGRGSDDFIFSKNPFGAALYISRQVTFTDNNKSSWTQNPMGISAILIPPPCAKKVGGKGVVERVIVNDPGNGYLPVEEPGTGYPVTLILDDIIVENPGINYSDTDVIEIIPNNGAVLRPVIGSSGEVLDVEILNPGVGFNVYPSINMVPALETLSPPESGLRKPPTGINASFRPVFRVVRDPVQLLTENQINQQALIQVTDLVGLKQTGYVDGRSYYGAVYYDEGVPYAGYYKTAGTQVRVYNTLQESITAQVTTRPSAIQRSGTDVKSNNPTLNIPGTPQSTSE